MSIIFSVVQAWKNTKRGPMLEREESRRPNERNTKYFKKLKKGFLSNIRNPKCRWHFQRRLVAFYIISILYYMD